MVEKNLQIRNPNGEILNLKQFIEWYYSDYIGKKDFTPKDEDRVKQAVGSLQVDSVISRKELTKSVYGILGILDPKQTKLPPI